MVSKWGLVLLRIKDVSRQNTQVSIICKVGRDGSVQTPVTHPCWPTGGANPT